MQYRDLKKNTLNEFNANSRISCSLWQMPLSNEYFLHWHDYFTIDIIVEGTARNYNSYGYSNIEKGNMDLEDLPHLFLREKKMFKDIWKEQLISTSIWRRVSEADHYLS